MKHGATMHITQQLDGIHEDLVYIVECLAQNYTGEAKTELGELVAKIQESKQIADRHKKEIGDSLLLALDELRSRTDKEIVVVRIIKVRRLLRNTIRTLYGEPIQYPTNSAITFDAEMLDGELQANGSKDPK